MSTPGIELPTFRSVSKRSPHCAIYAPELAHGTFSYLIRYSRLKCPKTPVFPSSVAHSHFDLFAAFVFCLQHFVYLQYTSFICKARFYLQRFFFVCSVLFLFAAYFFCLQRSFFVCSVSFLFAAYFFYLQRSFFCLQRFFFVCSVSFLFAAFLFCLQLVPCGPSYF